MDAVFSHTTIGFICWALAGLIFMMFCAMAALIWDSLGAQDSGPDLPTGTPGNKPARPVSRAWFRLARMAG